MNEIYDILFYTFFTFTLTFSFKNYLLFPFLNDKINNYEIRNKCIESITEIINYGGNFIYGIYVLQNRSWLYKSNEWLDDHINHLNADDSIKIYYIFYCCRYISALFLILVEKRKNDFVEMFIHHIATILLVSLSYYTNFIRIGAITMIIFDFADISLHIAKVFNYLCKNNNKKIYEIVSDIFFLIFIISFIYTRNYLFSIVTYKFSSNIVFNTESNSLMSKVLFLLLITIYILQLYWLNCIFLSVKKKIFTGKTADVRSDSESDDDDVEFSNMNKFITKEKED